MKQRPKNCGGAGEVGTSQKQESSLWFDSAVGN